MSVGLQCDEVFPLSTAESDFLWQEVCKVQRHPVEVLTIRCVSSEESARLNETYRNKKGPTNVLTFSYEVPAEAAKDVGRREHDIALCMDIAGAQARERSAESRDYVAWLVVHAMLHATGLDHEVSADAAATMREQEHAVLRAGGYAILE